MANSKELTAAELQEHAELHFYCRSNDKCVVLPLLGHITALQSRITALESNLRDAEGRYEACYAVLTRLQGEK